MSQFSNCGLDTETGDAVPLKILFGGQRLRRRRGARTSLLLLETMWCRGPDTRVERVIPPCGAVGLLHILLFFHLRTER